MAAAATKFLSFPRAGLHINRRRKKAALLQKKEIISNLIKLSSVQTFLTYAFPKYYFPLVS